MAKQSGLKASNMGNVYVKLDDAVKAVERYCPAERWTQELNIAIAETARNEIADALRALPVSDGWDAMIAERLKSFGYTRLEFQLNNFGGYEATFYKENGLYREAGPLPAPPSD